MDISNDKSDSKKEEETDDYIRSTNPNDGEIEEEQNGNNANQNENIFESEKNVKIRESEDNILFNEEIEEKAKYFANNDNDINENDFFRSNCEDTCITNQILDATEQEVTNYTNI